MVGLLPIVARFRIMCSCGARESPFESCKPKEYYEAMDATHSVPVVIELIAPGRQESLTIGAQSKCIRRKGYDDLCVYVSGAAVTTFAWITIESHIARPAGVVG